MDDSKTNAREAAEKGFPRVKKTRVLVPEGPRTYEADFDSLPDHVKFRLMNPQARRKMAAFEKEALNRSKTGAKPPLSPRQVFGIAALSFLTGGALAAFAMTDREPQPQATGAPAPAAQQGRNPAP